MPQEIKPPARIAMIMIDGRFVHMEFEDLRDEDIFRLLEPDGSRDGDQTWIAIGEVYDGDVKIVPSIQARPAGR